MIQFESFSGMSYRFFREHSQIIAACLTSGFTVAHFLYKNTKSIWLRDIYEFKNSKDIYEGLSLKEEQAVQKFLYRLEGNKRTIEFFRTNTLDFQGFGFNSTKQGAEIGLPASYFVNSKEELLKYLPNQLFNTQFGSSLNLSEKNGLDNQLKEILIDSLILSEDAKLFGLARAVQETNHMIKSNLDIFLDLACMMSCYMYCYSRNRMLKLQLNQRKAMYFKTIFVFVSLAIAGRFLIYKFLDYNIDRKSCQMGLDCSEGSQEFYDKLILRNKILRNVLPNGHLLIDQDGNYLKQTLYLPFTDFYFYINFLGLKLTDRKEICKKELNNYITKLEKDSNKKKP